GVLTYRLALEIRTRTLTPPGLWVSFVDAQSGEVLSVHNEVRFLDGTILAQHDLRTVDPAVDLVISPLAYADVDGDTTVQTDALGAFSVEGKSALTTLVGDWTRVNNQTGAEGVLPVVAGENTWDLTSATQAEIDTYVFLNFTHDWAVTNDIGGIETHSIQRSEERRGGK